MAAQAMNSLATCRFTLQGRFRQEQYIANLLSAQFFVARVDFSYANDWINLTWRLAEEEDGGKELSKLKRGEWELAINVAVGSLVLCGVL